MKMDLNYLKKLVKMLDSSNLAEMEIEEEGLKIRLSKPRPKISQNIPTVTLPNFIEHNSPAPKIQETPAEKKAEEKKAESKKPENLLEIRSPMVGTFYAAPSPDADSYVKVGSEIRPGTTVCIIEAMKLMNEIESEVSGKIAEICVKNGQAVEYDHLLFLVEKK